VFLGEVPDAKAHELVERVGAPIAQPAYELTFSGIGVFPPRGAPRVLWLGAAAGARDTEAVQRELAGRVSALGIPLEDRSFHAHLTLGRWRESRAADREQAIAAASTRSIAKVRVDHATLYHSRLSSSGPTYTALARATLTG
jgi:2'-5' RNA ligase